MSQTCCVPARKPAPNLFLLSRRDKSNLSATSFRPPKTSPTDREPDCDHVRIVECALKPVRCSCVNSLDETVVPHILPTLLNMPGTAHLAVRYTNIKLVGYLSNWLNGHHQYLGKTILLSTLLRTSDFVKAASNPSFHRCRGPGPPSKTMFLGPQESLAQTGAQSVKPFLHTKAK